MLEKYFGKSLGKGKTNYQKDLEEGTKNKKEPASSSYGTLLKYYGALFAGLSTVSTAFTVVDALIMPYPDNICFVGIVGIPTSVMTGAIGISLLRDSFRERRKEKDAHYNMHD